MKKHRTERGAATAEYAVGTVGATFIAYCLLRLTIGGPDKNWYARFVHDLIDRAFELPGVFGGDNWAWPWFM